MMPQETQKGDKIRREWKIYLPISFWVVPIGKRTPSTKEKEIVVGLRTWQLGKKISAETARAAFDGL
jgi:hypothetical protein